MSPRRRIAALVLVAALLSLAGCGSSGGAAAPLVAPGPAALAQAPGPVVVTLWHGLGGAAGTALDTQVAAFNRANAGRIELRSAYQGSYADTLAKYTAAIRDGSTPGILVTNDVTTGFVRDAGQTIPAASLAAANPGDLDPASLRPAARNYYSSDGTLLAVPLATSMPLLYVDDAVLARAGVDRSTLGTLAGVAAAARLVHDRTGVPGLVQPFDGWWFEQLAAGSGQPWCTPDNGRGPTGADALTIAPQTRAAIGTVADLYRTGIALNTGSDGNQALSAFAGGKVGMMLNSSGAIGGLKQSRPAGWTALPYPVSADRASAGALIGGAAMWVDGAHHQPAEIVAGWKAVSFLASPAAQIPFTQASGYAPVVSAVDADPAEQAYLAANPAADVLRNQFAATPATPATAGCLSGAVPGVRDDVVKQMQPAFAGTQPADQALDAAQAAATARIQAYRKQAGR